MKIEIDIQVINELQEFYGRIFEKRDLLNSKRPLPDSVLQKIKEDISIEWTYNSNSIEGNTFTLQETKIVLQDGITVGGKSLREHFETTNHYEAITYLESLVQPNYVLKEKDILKIHEIVLSKIEQEFGGRYRNGAVRIVGANFIPPNALKVDDLMTELINWVNENPENINPIVLASYFHHQFVHIHPFFDGNGRTVRLIMNLLLMKEGFPPAIILKNDRKKYYEALNQANKGNFHKLLLLVAQALERTLNIYLNAYPSTSLEDDYQFVGDIANEPDVPYGQEYLSLLARRGKIDAYKEGRNWLTSKSAVKKYITQKEKG